MEHNRNSKKLHLSDHGSTSPSKDISENEVEPEVPTLNVSSKDSPYALIDRFFPERESNQRMLNNLTNLGDLQASEVWLSDGDLLVLKGGTTPNRKAFDDPWTPLDDYEAPYREPKLPPPDFVPSDTGVGLPLPPEDTPEIIPQTTEKISHENFKSDFRKFLFDEEKFIAQMENFHSKRRDELLNSIEVPRLQINLAGPTFEPVNTTPKPNGYYLKPTTIPEIHEINDKGYFVTTSTPNR